MVRGEIVKSLANADILVEHPNVDVGIDVRFRLVRSLTHQRRPDRNKVRKRGKGVYFRLRTDEVKRAAMPRSNPVPSRLDRKRTVCRGIADVMGISARKVRARRKRVRKGVETRTGTGKP